MSESELAYIYLLQDGEDKGTNVYKIGRTLQKDGDGRKLKRLQAYSKGTVPYNTWKVNVNMLNTIETEIKEAFRERYCLVRGTEWFAGDVKQMKKDIDKIIDDFEETSNCEECIACNGSGISYWCDDTYGECLECGGGAANTHFTCVEDVLRCDDVSKEDKKRLIACLARVTNYYDMHNAEPIWGKCDIKYKDHIGIYKVHADRSLSFDQSIDVTRFLKMKIGIA